MDARELVKALHSGRARAWEWYVARVATILSVALALYMVGLFIRSGF